MAKKTKAQLQAELNSGKSIADVAAQHEAVGEVSAPDAPVAQGAPVVEVKKGPGKIAQIINHFKSGLSTKQIAALPVLDAEGQPLVTGTNDDGSAILETFHPTTISIQVNKYKKANPDLYPPLPPAKTKK